MTKQLLVEFLGTFFLVLVVALTGNPIAVGAVLAALVYMGGYISGAHYNPAVTLAFWATHKISQQTALQYMVVQLLGSFAAALVYFLIEGRAFTLQLGIGIGASAALIIEVLFTFLLASVILHVAATEKTKGNDYYGIAIGLTLMAAAFVGGPISGGVFNPAVGIGPLLFDIANLGEHVTSFLTYLIGPFLGGALAAYVYKTLKL